MYARFIRLSWINQNSLDFVVVVVVFWGLWSERCFSKYKMSLRLNFASFFFIFSFCFFSCLESTVWMFYIVCFINFFCFRDLSLKFIRRLNLDVAICRNGKAIDLHSTKTYWHSYASLKMINCFICYGRPTDKQKIKKNEWMNK